jgi:hypothetical protein
MRKAVEIGEKELKGVILMSRSAAPAKVGVLRLFRRSGGKTTTFSNASRYDVDPHLRGENKGKSSGQRRRERGKRRRELSYDNEQRPLLRWSTAKILMKIFKIYLFLNFFNLQ